MLERYLPASKTIGRLRSSVLGDHVDGFCQALADRGYAVLAVRSKLQIVDRFTRWMRAEGVPESGLGEGVVDAFLAAVPGSGGPRGGWRKTLAQLLEQLRATGHVPPVASVEGEDGSPLLARFLTYLRQERHLAASTVIAYESFAAPFLVENALDDPERRRALGHLDVERFMLARVPGMKPGRVQAMACALRSFLRFLFLRGEIARDLVGAVPTVRRWRLAGVPGFLDAAEVERLLGTCDVSSVAGRRNRVILLLLARLALRTGEIVRLELDDIRWREGEIVVRGKGGAMQRMPLPHEVGVALADYLRRDRPACASRSVFICLRAPHRGFTNAAGVGSVVSRSLARAELRPAKRGGHLLRHSLATQLLRAGASMSEIGQLLRHRSAATTEIYAKVDFGSLRDVAIPWPRSLGGPL